MSSQIRGLFSLLLLGAFCACSPEVVVESTSSGASSGSTGGTTGGGNGAACIMNLVSAPGSTAGVVNDGHTAGSINTSDVVMGSASHLHGSWYFEVEVVDSSAEGTWWAQNIGAATRESILAGVQTGALYNRNGFITNDQSQSLGDSHAPYGVGDVIGVALDLDHGMAYFRKNDTWQNADPSVGALGLEISIVAGTGTYYPVLGLSTGDVLTINFGESPFAHEPPPGFSPFVSGLEADASGHCIDEGPGGQTQTPAPVTAICATADLTSYMTEMPASPELHVIGVYEPETPGGVIDVHVSRPGSMALVLASYSAVHWNVTADPGVDLQSIVVSGYEAATLNAPAGVATKIETIATTGSYLGTGYKWPSAPGGSDTQALVKASEATTGLALTSFSGCYNGQSFTLTAD